MKSSTRSLAAAIAAVAILAVAPAAHAAVVTDSFTGTNGTLLENHTGEVGAIWNFHPNYAADLKLQDGRVWGPEWGLYYASGTPPTAEYDVSADLYVKSNAGAIGVIARANTSGTDALYMARYNAATTAWELVKCTTTCVTLGTPYVQTLTVGSTYGLKLEVRNATKKLFVNGVERVSSTDNTITQVGKAGIRSGPGVTTATTGYHLDNFSVEAASADTTITSGPSGDTNNASPSFTFNSIPSGGTFECRLDVGSTQGSWGSCPSPTSYSSLADGQYTFNVRATVGGVTDPSPATSAFRVDTAAPETTIDSGPTGTITTSTATFGFSSLDPTASFECSMDGASYAVCTSTTTYSSLANGSHTFSVRAKDPAGNVDASPSSRTFTVSASASPPSYTVTFQDSFEGATFPQTQQTGAWCGNCGTSGKLLDGTGAYFNQVTPSGFSAVDGTKIAESGLTTTSTRSEIQCHSEAAPVKCAGGEGTEWVYEWSVRIPSTVTVPNQPHPRRPNIMQTKPRDAGCYGGGMVVWPSTDSTKFELRQNIRGGTITDGTGGCTMNVADTVHLLGTFTKGAWHRVVLHAKWSTSSTVGFEEMWIDGVQVMPKQTRPTMIVDTGGDAILFRLGIYNSINASNWNVQYDHVKIGTVP